MPTTERGRATRVNHLIETWGYWAVALLVFTEASGVPLPGETALVTAAAYAGHSHHLSPWWLYLSAVLSSFLGGQVGYLLGRYGGHALVRRHGRTIRVDESKLLVGRYLFDRHGPKIVVLGRFVVVLRTYVAFLAGTVRMRARRFALGNAVGASLWAGLVTLLAYVAGNALRRASTTVTWAALGVAVVAGVAGFLLLTRRFEELSARATAAYSPTASGTSGPHQPQLPSRQSDAWGEQRPSGCGDLGSGCGVAAERQGKGGAMPAWRDHHDRRVR